MPKKPLALLVDADQHKAAELIEQLDTHGFEVVHSRSLVDSNNRLDELVPDVAVIALNVPDGDGLSLLRHPALDNTREIILTHHEDDPERVRQGILSGAGYFFCSPADQQFLLDLLHDIATELQQSSVGPVSVFSASVPLDQFGLLRGSSPPMHKLYRTVRKVAPSEVNVFLIGENGTGKKLLARTLHQLSERSTGPFIVLKCGAIPADRIDAELFGYEPSNERRAGAFERAYGGTLLLDEITEMPGEVQVKLLGALETGSLRRLGGNHDIYTDVRVIAATNRDAEEAVHNRQLREDLYFHLAGFPLHVPPLRARGRDVSGLAEFFIEHFNEQSGGDKILSRDAAAVLEAYSWPGNVRELRSVVEQAYIMAEHDIAPEHLPDLNGQPASSGDVLQLNIGDSVQDAEKKLTLATLTFYNGDKRKAAQTLGVSLKTLYNRINAYQADKRPSSLSSTAE